MQASYWSKVLHRRISRRRALAMTGATGASIAFLAACGGDQEDDGTGNGATGGGQGAQGSNGDLLTKPVDTLSEAKRGGIMKDRTHGDVTTFDPFTPNNTLNSIAGMTNSSLVRFRPGLMKPTENEIDPDFAESWEFSADGLELVMKVRQGAKFHNKRPVDGREVDMDDVLFSWERFAAKSTTRDGIVNAVSPDAPVLSLTSTDDQTIVIKLKEPIIHALGLFTSNNTGGMIILPKEVDSTLDVRGDTISTGPFYLDSYEPSEGFTLKRHPEYWDPDSALVDQVDKPIVTEYSSVLAQFKAGNIYTFGSYLSGQQIEAEDVLPTKQEEPRILIYQGPLHNGGMIGRRMGLGWLPEGESPFLDERVRQAISMGMQRDAYLDTFFNISQFEASGLPVEARWHTQLSADFDPWWLDPKGSDFGPNAKYYQHNIEEAKKLLAAAGYPEGFETTSSYVTGRELSATPTHAEVLDGFMRELGITVNVNSLEYELEYVPDYRDGNGQYEGWTYTSTAGAPNGGEAIIDLANQYWSKGGAGSYLGMSLTGKNDQSGDPEVDALIEKGRLERDRETRREIVNDLQRYLSKAMYAVYSPGMGSIFVVAWPAVRNYRVWWDDRMNERIWIDETKAPISG